MVTEDAKAIVDHEVLNGMDVDNGKKKAKKCKFYNRGFCKYKQKGCRFPHPQQICKEYLNNLKCTIKDCGDRHPSDCKWFEVNRGVSMAKNASSFM